MAIRKDIDDMLNTLNNDADSILSPKKLPPINRSNVELSADDIVDTLRAQSEPRKKTRRKRITIGELPDYEALRAQEAERERLERERQSAQKYAEEIAERQRITAERKAAEQEEKARQERIRAEQERREAAEKAERERIAAEKEAAEKAEKERIAAEKEAAEQEEKARQARIKAEQERLEAERKAAEKAEKARIAAEKKAEAERIKAEKAAEKKRLKEQREAEKAKRAEEKRAAEEAHKARLEAEKAKKAEQERLEAERKAAENATNATLSASDNFSIEEIKDGPERSCNSGNKSENNEPKEVSGGFIELFKHILNEDPDEIINQQNDSTEQDEKRRKKKLKRTAYSVFGVIFAVFACIGLIAVVAKGIDMIGTFKSRDPNRENFEKFLYPAVIMDIESFETPAELTSEQILTAAIWSMIMTDGITEQYELTFDVVMIPAADVEAYAVKLFGNELPELVHTTVGPAESRFYYNEETQLYNVPVAPVTHTYSPEVRGATKSGDDYILVVDYIDELPAWLPRTSSKSVEFVITSTDNGYHLKSMKILTTSTNTV